MVDGHCLIVPMQHVMCGTQVDEDVWAEIQVYNVVQKEMDLDFSSHLIVQIEPINHLFN